MAIALAEADKYEILDKIGMLFLLMTQFIFYMFKTNLIYSFRLRFLRDHSQSQAEVRWIRKCSALLASCNYH
jgi:hypothetical protein